MAKADKRTIWARRIAACERSGMSRRSWCAAHGVSVNTLDYWRRRLRAPTAWGTEGRRSRRQGLVPIRVQSAPGSLASAAALEVALPSGIVLRTPVSIEVGMLAALVRELRAC